MDKINCLITTSLDAKSPKTLLLAEELTCIIPHSLFVKRGETFPEHNILIKIVEQHDMPHNVRIRSSETCKISLPEIELRIIEYKANKQMRNRSELKSFLSPELVIGNFATQNGSFVADWLIQIFPMDMDNLANRVVSFHPYNDFILFRTHRYRFKNNEKVDFQDIGPHLTFRLRKIIYEDREEKIEYKKNKYDGSNIVL